MHNILLFLVFLALPLNMLWAQVTPINHDMKNLKIGNTFIYHYQAFDIKAQKEISQYTFERVIGYDTLNNKLYAVYQSGWRERADSSGVYWIPLSFDRTKPFTQEYLRYPLFPTPINKITLLNCGGFMTSSCFPMDDSISTPRNATINPDPEVNINVIGIMVRNFFLGAVGLGVVNYATKLGPWQSAYAPGNYRYLTTLCGALIEGKYYGDSACLVASSSPLQAADFTTLSPSLAPNPVSDIATLRFILPTAQGVTIEICDMLGREVAQPLRFDALSSGMNALPIDVARMARGVYAVRLRTALGLRATTMMVKE